MRRLQRLIWSAILFVALGAGGYAAASMIGGGDYHVHVLLPNAPNLVSGERVEINGFTVGKVSSLTTRDGRAVVDVALHGSQVPLHAGTTATIEWQSLLGERILVLHPASPRNPVIPNGGMIEGTLDRVEIDTVLDALDAPTRAKLASLIHQLDSTVSGHETDMQRTLQTAGPTVQALGQVLQAVGEDGPSIHALVERLHQMIGTLAANQQSLRSTISSLTGTTGALVGEQEQLRSAIAQLPGTLGQANRTLGTVPAAVQQAVPFLNQLEPATRRLPAVARNLSPLLVDLRPTVAELRPTLVAAQSLLNYTPALLDAVDATVPGLQTTLTGLEPAVAFLRPYTPEVVGWLSEVGSATANYDGVGHYFRTVLRFNAANVAANPGVLPPGMTKNLYPLPGQAEGQPWTDANGSTMR